MLTGGPTSRHDGHYRRDHRRRRHFDRHSPRRQGRRVGQGSSPTRSATRWPRSATFFPDLPHFSSAWIARVRTPSRKWSTRSRRARQNAVVIHQQHLEGNDREGDVEMTGRLPGLAAAAQVRPPAQFLAHLFDLLATGGRVALRSRAVDDPVPQVDARPRRQRARRTIGFPPAPRTSRNSLLDRSTSSSSEYVTAKPSVQPSCTSAVDRCRSSQGPRRSLRVGISTSAPNRGRRVRRNGLPLGASFPAFSAADWSKARPRRERAVRGR